MAASLNSFFSVLSGATGWGSRPFLHYFNCHHCSHVQQQVSLLPPRKKCNLNSGTSLLKDSAFRVSRGITEVEDGIDDETCELVSGVELSIGEGDESVRAYLFKAVKNNNGTGLLLLSDIFGFEDSSTRDFAYRVACNGYNVLVPDLFRGDSWSKDREQSIFEQWMVKHDPERLTEDIAVCTEWMVDEFMAAGISKKLGIIGFGYGGGRVIDVLAKDHNASFGIGVSFYGAKADLSLASDVKVPVLFISGDQLSEVDVVYEMEKRIGKGSEVVVFKGRGDGFAHRPESPEEDRDAEESFSIMRNWLHEGLLVNN